MSTQIANYRLSQSFHTLTHWQSIGGEPSAVILGVKKYKYNKTTVVLGKDSYYNTHTTVLFGTPYIYNSEGILEDNYVDNLPDDTDPTVIRDDDYKEETGMVYTGTQIIKNALRFTNGLYVYWYGGKDNWCTNNLLNTLGNLYKNIYTSSYKSKCRTDIRNKKKCIDCSGLVCRAYEVADRGTSQFAGYFKEYKGPLKNGIILWRKGHTGIYYNGKVIEARGKDAGITTSRVYNSKYWSKLYCQEQVDYDK